MITRFALALVLALSVTACAEDSDGQTTAPTGTGDLIVGNTPQPSATADTEITIEGSAYGEDEITVSTGTTVAWINEDAMDQTVTHGEEGQPVGDARFDELVPPGETVSFTFEQPGTYHVTCTLHPEMNMTVVVED